MSISIPLMRSEGSEGLSISNLCVSQWAISRTRDASASKKKSHWNGSNEYDLDTGPKSGQNTVGLNKEGEREWI